MSRGRGQRSGRANRPGGPTAQVTAAPALVPGQTRDLFVVRLNEQLDALEGAPEAAGATGADYWRPRRQELSSLIGWPMIVALRSGNRDRAKMMASIYHHRLGDEARSMDLFLAPTSQLDAALGYAAMLPHLQSRESDISLYVPGGSANRDFVASCDLLEPELERWRGTGLEEERRRLAWKQGPGESGRTLGVLTHTSRRSALRAARAAIVESAIEGPLVVTVAVDSATLLEFGESHEETHTYQGLQTGVCAWGSDVSAVMSVEYLVDGRPLRLQFAHVVGSTDGRRWKGIDPHAEMAKARGAVSSFAAEHDLEIFFDEHTVLDIDESHPAAAWDKSGSSGSLPALSARELFGPTSCSHANSRWERNDLEAWLVCDDCFNGSVARVPAHRIPASSPLHRPIDDEQAYLDERRYWDAVHGRDPERVGSVTELQQAEPPMSMSAADYATDGGYGVRRAGRGLSSVREAMNRR